MDKSIFVNHRAIVSNVYETDDYRIEADNETIGDFCSLRRIISGELIVTLHWDTPT